MAIMVGILESLEADFAKNDIPTIIKEKFAKTKDYCERIRGVTSKLANLSKPVTATVYGDTKIIDLNKSR